MKDVVGHTEAASGVAGCIKVLLMMQHGIIPKQPNFLQLNPRIPALEPDRMAIPKQSQQWHSSRHMALVNNYGAAGSNAAIVLQEYIPSDSQSQRTATKSTDSREYPIFISAKTEENLVAYGKALQAYISRAHDVNIADIAWNLARKQNRKLEFIYTSTASSISALSEQLNIIASGSRIQKAPGTLSVVLCFGGQTGRFISLSEDVVESSTLLHHHLIHCDSVCRLLGLPSLFPRIFDPAPVQDLVILHAMLFSMQYSSAKAWLDAGLEVTTLIGHSFGQLTALCVAGSLDLRDGIRLVTERARFIQKLWGADPGVMLSVEGSHDQVHGLLEQTKTLHPSSTVDVACYNGPRNTVLAGDSDSIKAVEAVCHTSAVDVKTARLKNSHAYHSALTDPILPSFAAVAKTISWRRPIIPVETCSSNQSWSNVTADKVVQHTRQPVYFLDAVQRIASQHDSAVWLEAGSASPIIPMLRRVLPDTRRDLFLPVDLGSPNAWNGLAKITSKLWDAGSKSQFWPFHTSQKGGYGWLDLPPYQFTKNKHWIEYNPHAGMLQNDTGIATENKPTTELITLVHSNSTQALFSINTSHDFFLLCVSGHAVLGQSLCPASLYFELVVRAAQALNNGSSAVPNISGLRIVSPLPLTPAGRLLLSLSKSGDRQWAFSLNTQLRTDHSQTVHASGTVSFLDENKKVVRFQRMRRLLGSSRYSQIVNSPDANRLSGDVIYKVFGQTVNYAKYYQGVRNVVAYDSEVVGDVVVPSRPFNLPAGATDPVAVDNFLQVAGIHVNCLKDCKEHEVFVCTKIGEVAFGAITANDSTNPGSWTVYSNVESTGKGTVANDIVVLDPRSGDVALILIDAEFTSVSLSALHKVLSKLNQGPESLPARPAPAAEEIEQSRSNGIFPSVQDIRPEEPKAAGTSSIFPSVQRMLSEVLGVGIEEVQPQSSLIDLGVDSLMITEIASEINTRFQTSLSVNDLQDLDDVQALSARLQPLVSSGPIDEPNDIAGPPEETPLDRGLAPISSDYLANNGHSYDTVVDEAKLSRFRKDVFPLQSELVVAYIVEAFASLGCDLVTVRAGEHLKKVSISPRHEKVLNQIYHILQVAGIISSREGGFVRTDIPLPRVAARELHEAIVNKFPQHVSEHKLLHTTGPHLSDCLAGHTDPLSLLFRNAQARALLEDVYTNAPMFKAGTLFLSRFLVDILGRFEGNRKIRVLELGAGTGGTSSYLIEKLTASRRKFQYTFTDLSPSLVAAAKKKFAKYDFMQYAVMDIEKEPPQHLLEQYDVVISTNCIHATRHLVHSCTNIRRMLRKDGVLCLLELTQNLFWFDLVFGLLEGWWMFDDGRQHALASEGLWKRNLLDSGFRWIKWSTGDTEESNILRLIVAAASDDAEEEEEETNSNQSSVTQETITFKYADSLPLQADIYYPQTIQNGTARPIGETRLEC